ncbi:MAG: hypothetical protein ACOX6T_09900 [Myxococcales bacterium]|jgi:hypothetical protein
MKRLVLRLAPLALLGALVGSGCVVYEHGADADVTFYWDCAGYDCASVGVEEVLVQIWEGPRLEAEQFIPGTASGVTLEDFYSGHYTYEITGLDWRDRAIYFGSGSIYLHSGDNHFDVRLY